MTSYQRWINVATAMVVVWAFVVLGGCVVHSARQVTPSEIGHHIQEGFAATAHFEIVRGADVPNRAHNKNQATYRLDSDKDAYEADDEGLAHLQWVTLVWEENPFLLDFYLHGDVANPDRLALRVAHLDIRKFFHPSMAASGAASAASSGAASVASPSTDRNLIRLQAYFEEFSRKAKIIYALENRPAPGAPHPEMPVLQRISSLVLVNNCREPGNYEIRVRDSLNRHLLEANFSFPTAHYDRLLTRFHGIGIREQGTGIGVPWTILKREWLRYWDSLLPWNRIKSFPEVTLDALSQIHGDEVARVHGAIEPVDGRIPFEEYEVDQEVQRKSRPHFLGMEPLTYVRVDPTLPMPTGFEPPRGAKPAGALPDKAEPMPYWTARENKGKIVPHHFRTFEDIQRHDLFFSEFALNGVYTGRSDLEEDFDWERKEGRWHFQFRYLGGLARFEMREWEGGYTELRLIGEATDKKAVNFVIGNFRLNPGERTEFLFGLGTQPLIADYNHNPIQAPIRYALAYHADGTILDHHDRGIGVEKVFVERIDEASYKIRLISYERILPVWEGMIRAPA